MSTITDTKEEKRGILTVDTKEEKKRGDNTNATSVSYPTKMAYIDEDNGIVRINYFNPEDKTVKSYMLSEADEPSFSRPYRLCGLKNGDLFIQYTDSKTKPDSVVFDFEIYDLDKKKVRIATPMEVLSQLSVIIDTNIKNDINTKAVDRKTGQPIIITDIKIRLEDSESKITLINNELIGVTFSFRININQRMLIKSLLQVIFKITTMTIDSYYIDGKVREGDYLIQQTDPRYGPWQKNIKITSLNTNKSITLENLSKDLYYKHPTIINDKLYVATSWQQILVVNPETGEKYYDVMTNTDQYDYKYAPFYDNFIISEGEINNNRFVVKWKKNMAIPTPLSYYDHGYEQTEDGIEYEQLIDSNNKRVLLRLMTYDDTGNSKFILLDENLQEIVSSELSSGVSDMTLLFPTYDDSKIMARRLDIVIPTFKSRLPLALVPNIGRFL